MSDQTELSETIVKRLEDIVEKHQKSLMNELAKEVLKATNAAVAAEECAAKAQENSKSAAECAVAAQKATKEASNAVNDLQGVVLLKSELEVVKTDRDKKQEKLIKEEAYSRRNNSLFTGIAETHEPNEQIRTILSKLPGVDITKVDVVACVPDGKRSPPGEKARPIIVKFHRYADRKVVWKARKNKSLPEGVHIKEDYPSEIRGRRSNLKPYFNSAYMGYLRRPDAKVDYLQLDKLHINNQRYTYLTVGKVPVYIKENLHL